MGREPLTETSFDWFKKIEDYQASLTVTVAPYDGEDHPFLYLQLQSGASSGTLAVIHARHGGDAMKRTPSARLPGLLAQPSAGSRSIRRRCSSGAEMRPVPMSTACSSLQSAGSCSSRRSSIVRRARPSPDPGTATGDHKSS